MCITQFLYKTHGGQNSFRFFVETGMEAHGQLELCLPNPTYLWQNRPSRCIQSVANLNTLIIWISYKVVLNSNSQSW